MKAWASSVLLISLLGAACSHEDGGGHGGPHGGGLITHLAGQLMLHQFVKGGHAALTVVEQPVPLTIEHVIEPFSLPQAPTAREGPCTLYSHPACSAGCPEGAYCSGPDTCSPLVPYRNIDIGEVRVTGSRLAPLIRLWFTTPDTAYDSDPPAGDADLFAGGETLKIEGGRGGHALHGEVRAPLPVVLRGLDPQAGLPRSGPAALSWTPAGAHEMVLRLLVSRGDGRSGLIRCLYPDSGAAQVPAGLLRALPPPPRTVNIEFERHDERLLPIAQPGVAIAIHAAFSFPLAWEE